MAWMVDGSGLFSGRYDVALTVKERNQLVVLRNKEKEHCVPLTDDEREAIEHRIKETYSSMPTIMTGLMKPWNKYCHILQDISADNSRLIAEIDRLTFLLEKTENKSRK